jgi:hypothetical protein
MTVSKNFGLLLVAGLLTPACALWGVEPEEIDLANETDSGYSAGSGNSGDGDGDHGMGDSGTEGEEDPTGPGDGDPGDGDGDPGDGDGDPSTGDGDGDGDGDPSTGDGDPGDGDGDGDGDADMPCELFEPTAVLEADNAIDIPNVMSSFEGSCGSAGPDAVFSFTATSDATYEFTLASNAFEGVLYLVDGTSCDPLEEIACEPEGQAISHAMLVDEVVYIIVDSDAGPGAATLSIAAI